MSTPLAWILAAHAVLFIALGLRVIHLRLTRRVGIGDGGDKELKRAIRVHANFAEWVPLTLFVLYAAELRGSSETVIAALGATLLLARVAHAIGLSRRVGAGMARSGGMTLNLVVLLSCAVLTAIGG